MSPEPSIASVLRRLRRRWPLALGSLWLATALLWLADATGRGLPDLLDGMVATAALAGSAVALVGAALRLWRSGRGGRILLALVALSVVVYLTGLAQELTMRYFGDEGIYLAEARRMNSGRGLLRPWFIYPHLLFYLDAFALWLASLFGPITHALAAGLYGVTAPKAVPALVTRGVTALMGAALVVPVFLAGRRLSGLVGATLGATLVIVSPLLVRVAHLNISDVAGAFFATLCLAQCAFLLESESRRGYLLGGLWAGLAAGGKYPAGTAAVAVAGVWVAHRLRNRDLRPGLLWAALAAILAFLATTPSLVAFYDQVFTGSGPDILFGFRQYARSGWSGVVRASNTEYYLTQLFYTFGLPALVLGLAGIPALDRKARRDLLWLTPFPVAYLVLLLAMRIAVPRNLLPILPALALLLGAGAAGWPALAARLRPRWVPALTAAVAVGCLALPAWWTVVLTVQFSRASTRELAADWIPKHLPPGSFLVQETYTPRVRPLELYPASHPRFVSRLTPEQLRHPRNDFVFVASAAYWRFFNTEGQDPGHVESGVERYVEIFETFKPVADWEPGRFRAGPTLRLFEVDPVHPPWTHRMDWPASDLLLRSAAMRPNEDGPVVFASLGQWALAKGYLEPGTYEVTADADVTRHEGGVRVLTRSAEEVAVGVFLDEPVTRVTLPAREKYFLYVRLPEGSVLRGLRVERVSPG
jgi:4-amino-4-deoxy-L-arabinose transferase-like glycosyltransferase